MTDKQKGEGEGEEVRRGEGRVDREGNEVGGGNRYMERESYVGIGMDEGGGEING